MHKVFISYRRTDTMDVAGRLYDLLVRVLGRTNVFKDVDSIDGGARFAEEIERNIGESDAVLILIGLEWLNAQDSEGGRRLDNEKDFVRNEIITAFRMERTVIPILVGDATMPSINSLPEPLRELAEINALPLRPDPDFTRDFARITSAIGIRKKHWIWIIFSVVAILALGLIIVELRIKYIPIEQTPIVAPDPPPAEIPSEIKQIQGVPIVPYDPSFLGDGHRVPLPKLESTIAQDAFEEGRAFDYLHYSLVMHEQRSLAIYAAINVDRSQWIDVSRDGREQWFIDDRLPRAMQRDMGLYQRNDWDRGHLISRHFVNWKDPAVEDHSAYRRAVFFYSATAPQHANFNRFLWSRLERYLFRGWQKESERLIVFIGPVFRDDDPTYRSTRIPRSFWAVAVTVDPSNKNLLRVSAFIADQLLTDENGRPVISPEGEPVGLARTRFEPEDVSVSVKALSELTGLDFGYLEQYDLFVE